jgi:hypothetical protein
MYEQVFEIYDLKDYFKPMFQILLKESPDELIRDLFVKSKVNSDSALFKHKEFSSEIIDFSTEDSSKFYELFNWNPVKPLLAMYIDNIKCNYPESMFGAYLINEQHKFYKIGFPCYTGDNVLEKLFSEYENETFYDNNCCELIELLYSVLISQNISETEKETIIKFAMHDAVIDKPEIRDIIKKLENDQPCIYYPRLDEYLYCNIYGLGIIDNIIGETQLYKPIEEDTNNEYEDSFSNVLKQLSYNLYDIDG